MRYGVGIGVVHDGRIQAMQHHDVLTICLKGIRNPIYP